VVFIPKCRRKTLYGQLRQHLGEVFRKLAMQIEFDHREHADRVEQTRPARPNPKVGELARGPRPVNRELAEYLFSGSYPAELN